MIIKYALIATAALLLAMDGYGQGRSGSSEWQSPRSQSSNMQQDQIQQQTLSGRIESIRNVNVKTRSGAQGVHSIARLQTQQGRLAIVDLGSKSNLDRLNLQQGDRIQVKGRQATVSGRNVFMADMLRVNGDTVAVQRPGFQQRSAQTAQHQRQKRQVQLTGTVQGFRHVDVRGSQGTQRQKHTLVRLQTENGKTIVANLGPKSRLEQLNLKKGERVQVQGHQGTLDHQPVLLVDRLARTSRSGQISQSQEGSRAATAEPFTVRGTVQGYQIVGIEAGQREAVLLNLQLEDGRSIIVDAGQYQPGELNLNNLNIQDQVTIKGKRISKGNRQILRADDIRLNEPMGADRPQGSQSMQSDKQFKERQRSGDSQKRSGSSQ